MPCGSVNVVSTNETPPSSLHISLGFKIVSWPIPQKKKWLDFVKCGLEVGTSRFEFGLNENLWVEQEVIKNNAVNNIKYFFIKNNLNLKIRIE